MAKKSIKTKSKPKKQVVIKKKHAKKAPVPKKKSVAKPAKKIRQSKSSSQKSSTKNKNIAQSKKAKSPNPPVSSAHAPVSVPSNEFEIGKVTHYFTHIMVAVIEVTNGELKVGDTIHIRGATSDFKQRVNSMQIEHQPVQVAKRGEAIGLKIIEHAREHDQVFVVK